MNLTRWASTLAFSALLATLFVPSIVSANIHVELRLEDPVTGILTLIAINFTTDLLLITIAVFAILAWKKREMGNIPDSSREFIISVIVASAAVAVAGGVIDFAFLYERVDDHYVMTDLTTERIVPAVILIFITIVAFMRTVVGIRLPLCAPAGVVIGSLSPLAWVTEEFAFGHPLLMCALSWTIVTGVLAILLLKWMRSCHLRIISRAYEWAYEGGEP